MTASSLLAELEQQGVILYIARGKIKCVADREISNTAKELLKHVKEEEAQIIKELKNSGLCWRIYGRPGDFTEKEWTSALKDARKTIAVSQNTDRDKIQNKVYFIRAVLNYLNKKEEDKPLYKHIWKNMPISN